MARLRGAGSQKIAQMGQAALTKLVESQTWHLPVTHGCVGGKLNKGTVGPAITSVWEKSAPLALTLKPDNSIPLCLSLKLFASCYPFSGA